MDIDNPIVGLIAVLLITGLVGYTLFDVGYNSGVKATRIEAVKAKHGHWEFVNEAGKKEFKWGVEK